MNPIRINTYTRYMEIVERYGGKGCLSNDYLQKEAAALIIEGSLYEYCGRNNAFILVKKHGFWRVYYYLNDLQERLILNDIVMTSEILFRSILGEPTDQVEYLERCGFRRHLIRDQYSAMYKDLTSPIPNEEIAIQPAQTHFDVKQSVDLFNASFDKFTGDYIPPEMYHDLLVSGDILMVWNGAGVNAEFLGALHQTVNNNVAWISHLAVKEQARGKHVGKSLLDTFVENNMVNGKTRYSLWVQRQNLAAVAMYSRKGFKHNGKSSLSMIKQII